MTNGTIFKRKNEKKEEKRLHVYLFLLNSEISHCMVSPVFFFNTCVFSEFLPSRLYIFLFDKLIFYWLLKTGRVSRIVQYVDYYWIIG